jgi:twitching motility two-component system response regulator PilG
MSTSESFSGLTVMVIDDSNTIRRSAEIFLGKTGAKVVLAEDGFDALAKIADHQPDLIFCDVLMPRLDGYQTCALIKKSPKFKSTPVVMLSSKDGLFDKAKGRMVGSDHYLTKPFTKDSLLLAVSEFARKGAPSATSSSANVSATTSARSSVPIPNASQPEIEAPLAAMDIVQGAEKFTLSLV